MPNLLTTTVIGSYTVQDWYPALQEAVTAGKLAPEAFSDAKAVAARAAIKDQEVANVDGVSDGELFRRDDNRFGPPNAMINYFAAKIPGFSGELRPKTGITPVAPEASLPAPVVVGPLEPTPLGLVDELSFLRATTERPVKIAMTGFAAILPVIQGANVDVVLIAFASLGVEDLTALHDFPRDKALGVGAVDVQTHRVGLLRKSPKRSSVWPPLSILNTCG